MTVEVALFARFRELAGTDVEDLELPDAATARDAWNELRRRHPLLPADPSGLRAARNEEFVGWDERLADGDRVAFIPPVSGGAAALIEITANPLDARRLESAVAHPGAGAICTFTGVVRDFSRGETVTHLEYEAYGAMAEKQMAAIADEIARRWPGTRVALAHRTGRLEVGEASVVVSTAAPHRAEAIAACKWGIDRLKESVPIWKKEHAASGATWIEEGEGAGG